MTVSAEVVATAFITPSRLWTVDEILREPTVIPKAPGVYAWYFSLAPAGTPIDACVVVDGHSLLYVGIASNLHKRILRQHLRWPARSTLRRTLGVLLEQELALVVRKNRDSFDYGETEARITEWMASCARLTWAEHDAPRLVESSIIHALQPPFNMHHRGGTFRAHVAALRKSARERTRE